MGGDHDVGAGAQRAQIARELGERFGVRPGEDRGGNARAVRGRDTGAPRLEHRRVRGVSREDGDTRGIVGGLVAGGPVHGGSLHEAETQTLVGDDRGSARGLAIHARAGARNAKSIELPERRPNRLLAVVDVVGVTDRAIPGDDEGLRGGERGIKTLALDRVPGGGLIEAGFQITEQHVGLPQRVLDQRERRLGIGDVHEIDVAGQHQHSFHADPLVGPGVRFNAGARRLAWVPAPGSTRRPEFRSHSDRSMPALPSRRPQSPRGAARTSRARRTPRPACRSAD